MAAAFGDAAFARGVDDLGQFALGLGHAVDHAFGRHVLFVQGLFGQLVHAWDEFEQ